MAVKILGDDSQIVLPATADLRILQHRPPQCGPHDSFSNHEEQQAELPSTGATVDPEPVSHPDVGKGDGYGTQRAALLDGSAGVPPGLSR